MQQPRSRKVTKPDAAKVSAKALSVPAAPTEAEKNVNGDFVLWPKLMNNPPIIGINTAGLKSVKI